MQVTIGCALLYLYILFCCCFVSVCPFKCCFFSPWSEIVKKKKKNREVKKKIEPPKFEAMKSCEVTTAETVKRGKKKERNSRAAAWQLHRHSMQKVTYSDNNNNNKKKKTRFRLLSSLPYELLFLLSSCGLNVALRVLSQIGMKREISKKKKKKSSKEVQMCLCFCVMRLMLCT